MEAKLKMIIGASLTFSLIGFVLYLLFILSGFMAHCFGISASGYDQILLILGLSALATFVVCFYTSCYRKWRKSLNVN
ncbi:MAG: hypothetical protein IH595_04495 [Bacteroidales bacterium]|nr:hypothetical protein [Bacteroidales bacterium]